MQLSRAVNWMCQKSVIRYCDDVADNALQSADVVGPITLPLCLGLLASVALPLAYILLKAALQKGAGFYQYVDNKQAIIIAITICSQPKERRAKCTRVKEKAAV